MSDRNPPFPPAGEGMLQSRDFASQVRFAARRLLDARRQYRGLRHDDLARATGMHTTGICSSLRGRQPLSLEMFILLCLALDLDAAETLTKAINEGRETLAALRRREATVEHAS